MEVFLEIPGLLDRMVEANLIPSAATFQIQDVASAGPVIPNTMPQAPVSKTDGTWVYLLGGLLVLGYIFRYEIEYYILGKPNKKYPKY
jgi:hypothetical protein